MRAWHLLIYPLRWTGARLPNTGTFTFSSFTVNTVLLYILCFVIGALPGVTYGISTDIMAKDATCKNELLVQL